MTVTSRIPALIDYLVNLFTNDPTIGLATPPVTVFDGTPTTLLDAPLKLYVGLNDPDNEGLQPAGESVQEWAALGRRGRNETSTIHLCAEAWSGSDTIQAQRLLCAGIVAAVETLMQADTTQFGGNVVFPDPGAQQFAWSQNNTTGGAVARCAFDLVFRSRIGG